MSSVPHGPKSSDPSSAEPEASQADASLPESAPQKTSHAPEAPADDAAPRPSLPPPSSNTTPHPSQPPPESSGHGHAAPTGKHLAALCLSALGIVYGDIGTSPLYALRECFAGEHGVPVTHDNVLGILSLIFWSLTITISIKYVAYVMRADNRGEGGILALMALATSKSAAEGKTRAAIIFLGLFGAALLYGDGMITPAISVLSAVEGLGVATPALEQWIKPITVTILVGLFLIQKRGTAQVGAIFGPITVVWFATLASLGVSQIVSRPEVLLAFNPAYGAHFLASNHLHGFLALGGVFLVVTGGEALYADMGHFGTRPIRLTWFSFVLPALVLNYLGQGALLLERPEAASHPFYELAPRWALLPLVGLSTMATIIASQALISGAFSITRQATMLGFWPRVQIQHTSAREIGQIYVPSINWMLMIATITLVITFGSSSNLAAAYGIAVTTTMVITTALAYVVTRYLWGWSRTKAVAITSVLILIDLAFFGANAVKIHQGGWVPLAVGAFIFLLMTTWKRGRAMIAERINEEIIPLDDFFEVMRIEMPARVPGTAVFMTSNPHGTPTALMHNFQHNRVVHQQVILLTIITEEVSYVLPHERVSVHKLPEGFVRVVARYGFMEVPDLAELLARKDTPTPPIEHTTFFLGRETLQIAGSKGMAEWRKRLFAFMARNGVRVTSFFSLPSDRVVELGGQIDL
jgi:KUP system potassium uptake protein